MKEGFAEHERRSPVTDAWRPIYASSEGGIVRLAIVLAERHCNGRGMLHGGVIAALADNAMGLSLGAAIAAKGDEEIERGRAKGIVTTSLSVDYLGVANIGQWIEIIPRVIHLGRGSGVVDALISADDQTIARADANFRILR